MAVKLHPKLQRRRHRKPIRRTTIRDIFPPFHAPSPLALWIVWRWRVMAGPGARKPPRGPPSPTNRPILGCRWRTGPLAPWPNLLSYILPALVVTPLASLFREEERDFIDVLLLLLLWLERNTYSYVGGSLTMRLVSWIFAFFRWTTMHPVGEWVNGRMKRACFSISSLSRFFIRFRPISFDKYLFFLGCRWKV